MRRRLMRRCWWCLLGRVVEGRTERGVRGKWKVDGGWMIWKGLGWEVWVGKGDGVLIES